MALLFAREDVSLLVEICDRPFSLFRFLVLVRMATTINVAKENQRFCCLVNVIFTAKPSFGKMKWNTIIQGATLWVAWTSFRQGTLVCVCFFRACLGCCCKTFWLFQSTTTTRVYTSTRTYISTMRDRHKWSTIRDLDWYKEYE